MTHSLTCEYEFSYSRDIIITSFAWFYFATISNNLIKLSTTDVSRFHFDAGPKYLLWQNKYTSV